MVIHVYVFTHNNIFVYVYISNNVYIYNYIFTMILDTYNTLPDVLNERCETDYHSLQLEMLHLLGAILSGSKVYPPYCLLHR